MGTDWITFEFSFSTCILCQFVVSMHRDTVLVRKLLQDAISKKKRLETLSAHNIFSVYLHSARYFDESTVSNPPQYYSEDAECGNFSRSSLQKETRNVSYASNLSVILELAKENGIS
jgi:hypothetical protein